MLLLKLTETAVAVNHHRKRRAGFNDWTVWNGFKIK